MAGSSAGAGAAEEAEADEGRSPSPAGKRPSGWVAPGLRFGEKTLDILSGEGIQWHACTLSDDLPYVIHVASRTMTVLPHAEKQMDDAGFVIGGRRPPEVYLDFLKRQFRTLYREGEQMPTMFNFSVHPEYGGRPFFIRTVEEGGTAKNSSVYSTNPQYSAS